MNSHYFKKKYIDNLIAIIVIFSSLTGWYNLDYIGMNKFWGVFIIFTIVMGMFIIQYGRKYGLKNNYNVIYSKQTLIIILYLVWMTATYLINQFNPESILYSGKMWFIILFFLLIMNYYFINQSKDEKNITVLTICKYLFVLGCLHCVVAIYQYIFLNNYLFSIRTTDWPANNPASMYANVNGLGTYLFISIAAGVILLFTKSVKRQKLLIIFLIIQCYVLYLTVARTSIVSIILFILIYGGGAIEFHKLKNKIAIRKDIIILVIATNLIMLNIIYVPTYRSILFNQKTRSTADMLLEKTEKGVNNRQFIWKAVIKDYKDYYLFGDGLKYNIVKNINVAEVISKKSEGVSRISYHNTLFRYFASNGMVGVLLFLVIMFYGAFKYISNIIISKDERIIRIISIALLVSIFAYMQMEEVYLGEVGMIQLITLILLAFIHSNSINNKEELQG